MIEIRAGILAVTICLIIFAIANQPRPVKDNQVAFCVVTYKVARKDPETGEIQYGWGKGYGPCSDQDIYRFI